MTAPAPTTTCESEWHYSQHRRMMTRCRADDDDHCDWSGCPQIRDGFCDVAGRVVEMAWRPHRHCPIDAEDADAAEGNR